MSKYTPGPWKIQREILNSPQPEYIYGGPESTHVCDFRELNPNLLDEVLEQQQANARLIAAAPDLLTACTQAVDAASVDILTLTNPAKFQARIVRYLEAAIAKATP